MVEIVEKSGTIWAEEMIQQFAHHYLVLLGDEEFQMDTPPYSDVEIAEATFILYTMSRDGMGSYFSSAKFKTHHYRMSKEAHEAFLCEAVKCGCKMLISNYDNQLYSDYLRDWTRIDIPVKTSVGGKKNNQRVEVLWYNY